MSDNRNASPFSEEELSAVLAYITDGQVETYVKETPGFPPPGRYVEAKLLGVALNYLDRAIATIRDLQQQAALKDQLLANMYSEVRWAKRDDAPGGICNECGRLVPRLVKLYEFGPNYHLKLHDHICPECCNRIGKEIEARNTNGGPTGAPE